MKKNLVIMTSLLIVAGCSQPTPPAESPAAPSAELQAGDAPAEVPASPGLNAADLAALAAQDYRTVQRGVTLSAKGPVSAVRPFLVSGWANDEPWGVWTVGEQARMGFKLEGPVDRDVEIVIALKAFVPPKEEQVTVVPSANGKQLAPIVVGGQAEPSRHTIQISSQELTQANGRIQLDFHIQNPRSPEQFGMSKDKRMLGVGLVEISLN